MIGIPPAELGVGSGEGFAHVFGLEVAVDERAVGAAAMSEKGGLLFYGYDHGILRYAGDIGLGTDVGGAREHPGVVGGILGSREAVSKSQHIAGGADGAFECGKDCAVDWARNAAAQAKGGVPITNSPGVVAIGDPAGEHHWRFAADCLAGADAIFHGFACAEVERAMKDAIEAPGLVFHEAEGFTFGIGDGEIEAHPPAAAGVWKFVVEEREGAVGGCVRCGGDADLAKVISADGVGGDEFGSGKGGEQERGKDSNDCDDDEQLDQSETGPQLIARSHSGMRLYQRQNGAQ
jgi:hypothetical protein